MSELKEVGLDARTARKHGIPTDVWRDTKYSENIEQLKSVAKSLKETKKQEKKTTEQPAKPTTKKKSAKKKTIKRKQKKRKK